MWLRRRTPNLDRAELSARVDQRAARLATVYATILALIGMGCTPGHARPPMENPSSDRSTDEAAIAAVEAAYDQAWNRGDAKALASLMADDAIVVNPRGQVANGKAEFERVISTLLAGEFKGSEHESTITLVHFPARDVAVVDGEASVVPPPPAQRTTVKFTDVMIRRDGRWMLTDVRAYVFLPGP
jgi:uncharacterized protein (TIGR02246 family)